MPPVKGVDSWVQPVALIQEEGLKALQGWEIIADCLRALWDGPAGVEMDVQLLSSQFVSFRALSCIASVPGSSISPDPELKALLSQISLTLCTLKTLLTAWR